MAPTSGWSKIGQIAFEIWTAGVQAVDSACLISDQIDCQESRLIVGNTVWNATEKSRICVVGAGKAGAGMALGLEKILGPRWLQKTSGWVNVPEDCVRTLNVIHLHGARPAGVNEPTEAGVEGTREILQRISSLGPDDLCIVLISGGGSALLPLPVTGITLEEKLKVTRLLSRGGASISELNCVRSALSQVKGGGLLRACRAGLLISLIISDVIGDPLEVIASGPTIPTPVDPERAIEVLRKFESPSGKEVPESVWKVLEAQCESLKTEGASAPDSPHCQHVNLVIGNNRTAVQAAAREAERRGFTVLSETWDEPGNAADCGRELADRLKHEMKPSPAAKKVCLISGGEPTVRLAKTSSPQKGGRNQELVLAAIAKLLKEGSPAESFAILSGGTDGEDGPTDAAGALIDSQILAQIRECGLDPEEFLAVNNSYPFLDQVGALLKTGPTHTNVMDLRVVLKESTADSAEETNASLK